MYVAFPFAILPCGELACDVQPAHSLNRQKFDADPQDRQTEELCAKNYRLICEASIF